ncbi:hypothetical protein IHE51_00780 [Candidatus Parvarchaeota archaeon]|uniref:Dam-replacing protein HTH domain-containing protein n=1 Tax=Candidatus Acidifodinimicrobium mancum TaxID=2898728 RepID=A0A8T3V1S3_9ARCH|nr:hypothetical protein [Candidatus Acidifodinimicrobium mancum]MBE5729117.1 hypothetical protein [Candidatus Acidifodinimicrobium mancum]MBE5730036.1 hypothetical protein [Candidatus Acidifodinimicrobium mancum]
MNLDLYQYYKDINYKSQSQISRAVTESWVSENLYCPNCGRDLLRYRTGMPVYDFYCDHSDSRTHAPARSFVSNADNFQLKSQAVPIFRYILGAEYNKAILSLRAGNFPSLILLHYNLNEKIVNDVEFVHKAVITQSCIIPRNPLSENAKRKGWQGFKIDLSRIPNIGRIKVVSNKSIKNKSDVMAEWKRVSYMVQGDVYERSWISDVMTCLEELPTNFTLSDAYKFEEKLKSLHPNNKHVKDKIRQQLQLLRNRNIIKFEGEGVYSKVKYILK